MHSNMHSCIHMLVYFCPCVLVVGVACMCLNMCIYMCLQVYTSMFTCMSMYTAMPVCVCANTPILSRCMCVHECAHIQNVVEIGHGTLDSRNNLLSF